MKEPKILPNDAKINNIKLLYFSDKNNVDK